MDAPAAAVTNILDIDPVLLAHTLPASPYDAPDSSDPRSPIEDSMVDPMLLALYPTSALALDSPVMAPFHSPVPSNSDNASPTHGTPFGESSGTEGTLSPSPTIYMSPHASTSVYRPAGGRKRRQTTSGGSTAVVPARRIRSNGIVVPPMPCARCIESGRFDACRVIFAGAACNACRIGRRKCSLVDGDVNPRTGKKKAVSD